MNSETAQEFSSNPEMVGSSSLKTPEKGDTEESEESIPFEGKIYMSMAEAKKSYEKYGTSKGFPTRVNSTACRIAYDNEPSLCLLVCGRQGYAKKQWSKDGENAEKPIIRRHTSTVKCGCTAKMRVVRNKAGEWVVRCFDDIHNHELITPGPKRVLMKANRSMPAIAKCLSIAFEEENLPVGKVCSMLGGDVIGFSERDCYNSNHLNSSKTYKTTQEGDATAAFMFFKKKQAEDPNLFYNIQTDYEGRAINFFWVDGRSRMQYSHFGDVVCFDITYKKNIYSMPFGPFTGVNHHHQSIQFGCALLLDETEESFVWLFETWLSAMRERHPISIITDQDLAMTNAIAKVFPNTRHRYCLWHIEQKFPEYFSHIYHKSPEFANELRKCLWWTFREHDFDARWKKLLVSYDLEQHPWLQGLFDMREKWVPAYNYNTFYAGMHTTGRSEGMNSFYKDYFTHNTSLRVFLLKYDKCLERICRREREEDYVSEHLDRNIYRGVDLQKHAAKFYTRTMFLKFDEEFVKAQTEYKIHSEIVDTDFNKYGVRSKRIGDHVEWMVSFNLTILEGFCECKYFQFKGIPCGHLLKVFMRHDIDEIPTYFVMRRWKQKSNQYRVNDEKDILTRAKDSYFLRLLHSQQLANQVASLAAKDDTSFKMLVCSLTELTEKLATLSTTQEAPVLNTRGSTNVVNEVPPIDPNVIVLKNPNVCKTKGRPKGKSHEQTSSRIKRGIEISQEVDVDGRKCGGCGLKVKGHDKRNCPNPHLLVSQSKKQRGKGLVMNDADMDNLEDIE